MAQNETIEIWEKDQLIVPPGYEDEVHEINDILRVSKVTNPIMDVYLPSKKNRKDLAMIICPGGGYRILAYEWEGGDFAKLLNAQGITAIVLKYRLPFEHNGKIDDTMPMRDALKAIQITRKEAERWGMNNPKVGIMGFSAGGHVASSAGVHYVDQDKLEGLDEIDQPSRPDFLGLIYPVVSFSKEYSHIGSRNNLLGENASDEKIDYYSGEEHVTADTPPTFLMHASDDKGVPVSNSIKFYEALIANNVPAEMHIYPRGGHGFGLGFNDKHLQQWPNLLVNWVLDQQ
ncbi:alpha/beta hydrolase [Membranihabitans marinus]